MLQKLCGRHGATADGFVEETVAVSPIAREIP
jgi:hypothetical protein